MTWTRPDGTKGKSSGTGGGYVQVPQVYQDHSGAFVGANGKYTVKYNLHQDYMCVSADGSVATGSHDFKASGSGKWTGTFPKK